MKNASKLMLVCLALSSGVAFAGGQGDIFAPEFYAGAGVGHTKLDGVASPNKATSFKALAGYRFLPNFAAEVAFDNFGKFGPADERARAVQADVLAIQPIGKADIFAKAGGAHSWVNHGGGSGNGANYGVGADYNFTRSIAVRGEYERFKHVGDTGMTAKTSSVSLLYKF